MVARVQAAGVWLAWFATVGLAWAAYNRLFVDDRTIPGTAFNAYTFWLFLPAYVMAAGFALLRWWRPAALCGLLMALHVFWVAPLYSGADALPAGAEDGPRLTVVSSNLTAGNPEKERHAQALQRLHGDVILLQEYTHEWADVLRKAGFHESHPYSIEAPEERWTGTAIFSRFPLSGAEPWDMHGTTATRAQLDETWGGLWLYSVHPDPPPFPVHEPLQAVGRPRGRGGNGDRPEAVRGGFQHHAVQRVVPRAEGHRARRMP